MSFFSYTCKTLRKIVFKFNGFKICLILVQIGESPRIQGKFATQGKLSAQLSTGIVDLFSLDLSRARLQPWPENRISLT